MSEHTVTTPPVSPESGHDSARRRLGYLHALREAQLLAMRDDDRVILLGTDLHANTYGTAQGFVEEFGPERVRNSPISEAGFCGAAIGAAMTGLRPIADLAISSFLWVAMDQLVSQASRLRYMSGGQLTLPVVFRLASFYQVSAAGHHSDRPHSTLMTVPGLKIVAPSGPYEAKGLLLSAIYEDDPVVVVEDATLWNRRAEVPEEMYTIPIGEAHTLRAGDDVTVVAIGGAVPHAIAAAENLARREPEVSVEVIDPRTLVPMDWATIVESVARTGRLVVADPGNLTCSAASEIAATVTEEAFSSLKSAPLRVTAPDIPIPFSPVLERPLFPNTERIMNAVDRVLTSSPGARA